MKDRYDQMLPLLTDLVIHTDLKGVIDHAYGNAAAFGYTCEELLGKELLSFVRDDTKESFHKSRTMPTQVAFLSRVMNLDVVSDEYAPAAVRSTEDGAVAVFTNVKRLHDLESVVQRTKDQLFEQEKMASIGQLAAGVAHEINNPLGFVSSNMATLATYIAPIKEILADVQALVEASKSKDDATVADKAEAIEELSEKHDIAFVMDDIEDLSKESLQGLDRIKKIVMDLKVYARKDIGEKAEADLNTVMDAALGIVHNKIKYHCQLVKEYAEPIALAEMNVQQMTQVFINLVVNGADAISGQGTITVRTYEKDGMVWGEVQDTGTGIPEEIRTKIFEPLFTTKEPGKGTGLGLSITSEIVRKHHGVLTLESTMGVGTVFKVGLPLKQPLV
jgi:signal transduction histidine kinase